MRFTTAAAAAGLAGVSSAQGWGSEGPSSWGSAVYTTDVVTAYTTYCPEATQITHAGTTYSVTSATTLTITNCPGGCTITKPVSSYTSPATSPVSPETTSVEVSATGYSTSSETSVVSPTPYTSAETSVITPTPYTSAESSPVSPVSTSVTVAPYPSANGTALAPYSSGSSAATLTSAYTSSSPIATTPPTGGAARYSAGFAGIFAILGLVAAL